MKTLSDDLTPAEGKRLVEMLLHLAREPEPCDRYELHRRAERVGAWIHHEGPIEDFPGWTRRDAKLLNRVLLHDDFETLIAIFANVTRYVLTGVKPGRWTVDDAGGEG